VDHFPVPFAELAAGYAEAVGGWAEIEVDLTWTGQEGSRLGTEDELVWGLYHQKYAAYRLLCSQCHRKTTHEEA
jgi:hypothetical protein